ncbi:MAG: methyl-accepting chemotaxis protein [Deltaproteobacteria bacterium]
MKSLVTKMLLLFGVIGVAFVLFGGYAVLVLQDTRARSQGLEELLGRARLASKLRVDVLSAELAVDRGLQPAARGNRDVLEAEELVRADLAAYQPVAQGPEVEQLAHLRDQILSAFSIAERGLSAVERNDAASLAVELGQWDAAKASIEPGLAMLSRRSEGETQAELHEIGLGFRGTNVSLAVMFLLVFGGMAFTLNRGVVVFGGLRSMAQLMREIADTGTLDRRVAVTRNDEVGDLAASFNKMIEALRNMVAQMKETTGGLSSAGTQIQAATAEQSASATEQAASVAEASTTIEEIRQTSEQAAERAQEMIGMADRSDQVSQTGAQAVIQSVQGINDVRARVDAIASNILALSERTQQIGDIIATVTELAERSNLLAVNASIEAAKAGDQGRGFAVVAREVHSLADQSKSATKQIRAILGEIQKATNDAVMVTEEGAKKADAAVRQAEQAGTNIRDLAQAIQATSQAARQIAASSRQQSIGIDQIVLAFKHISQATTESVAGSRQTEASASALKELSERLRQLVAGYRL